MLAAHPIERNVAIDTSLLLSADSFIGACADDSRDPRAGYSFEIVATAFCNGTNLFLPLPEHRNDIVPELVKPWSDVNCKVEVPELALPSSRMDEIADRLIVPFVRLAEGSSGTVASWLAFHFSDELSRIYFGRCA